MLNLVDFPKSNLNKKNISYGNVKGKLGRSIEYFHKKGSPVRDLFDKALLQIADKTDDVIGTVTFHKNSREIGSAADKWVWEKGFIAQAKGPFSIKRWLHQFMNGTPSVVFNPKTMQDIEQAAHTAIKKSREVGLI